MVYEKTHNNMDYHFISICFDNIYFNKQWYKSNMSKIKNRIQIEYKKEDKQ